MLMCMESVYVVGGCNIVAHKGMFCCSWLRSILYSKTNALLEKSGRFDCSSLEHTQHAQNTAEYALHDEDCRISSRDVSFFPIKHLVG